MMPISKHTQRQYRVLRFTQLVMNSRLPQLAYWIIGLTMALGIGNILLSVLSYQLKG